MPDNVELVRQLWTAFERGGLEGVLEVADPDVEWEPYGGGGTVYRGHEGLRAYMNERRARNEEADGRLYSAFAKGDFVVARGEIRIRGEHGIVTMQPGWLYEFRDGKLVRFRGFPTQEAALRAAGFAPRDAPSLVREFWNAFNRRDADRMAALVSDDCEWRPYKASREVYLGPQGIRDYYGEIFSATASASATEYSFREHGAGVAVSGSLQTVEKSGAIVQRQVHWAYWVRDGQIVRGQSYARRDDAVAAAEASAESG